MSHGNAATINGPRLRRLESDYRQMERLVETSPLLRMAPAGTPPSRYRVEFRVTGLWQPDETAQPLPLDRHIADLYLHRDYPRRPPQIVWRTEIFHPNILSGTRGGGVCIGGWSPSETLADLVVRLAEMIQYRQYNPDDALNPAAARWARYNKARLPVDHRPLLPAERTDDTSVPGGHL